MKQNFSKLESEKIPSRNDLVLEKGIISKNKFFFMLIQRPHSNFVVSIYILVNEINNNKISHKKI